MRLRRIRAISMKETLQIIRDPRSLMIALLIPLMQMFMFGYGVNLDVKHIPLCTLDWENSQTSQELLERFAASSYFNMQKAAANHPDIKRNLDDGSCRLAIVIPADFSQRLNDSGSSTVQVLVDGTDSNTASIAANYARSVIAGFSTDEQTRSIERKGGVVQTTTPVDTQARVWFNEELESRNFIVPGIVALVMAIVGAQLTSLTIAREWERGTMEQLVSTPVTPLEIMLGKLAPYFIIGMFDVVVCALLALYWFHVPFRGSFVALLISSALFMVVVLALGFFISVVAKNQLAASQMALLATFLPAFLLSGFLYAIEQMPVILQWITRILPARYYVSLLKKIFLKGTATSLLYADLIPLTIFALVLTVLATRSFHKRLV